MWSACVAIVLLAASSASAEPAKQKERAAKLFEEGRELATLAKYREACERFAKSFELEAAVGTQMNFADCQEHLGHLSRAFELFDDAATRADRSTHAVRAQYARDRANALLPRLGTVVLRIADRRYDLIKVTIGGRDVPAVAESHIRVDPGNVEIVVAMPEQRFVRTAHATARGTVVIDVPAPVGARAESTRKRPRWIAGAAVLGGMGLVAMSTAGAMGLYASRHYNKAFARGECFETPTNDQCTPAGLAIVDEARGRANLATAVFVGGAVLAGGGLAMYVLAPRERRAIEVRPTTTATSVGVTIGGRF